MFSTPYHHYRYVITLFVEADERDSIVHAFPFEIIDLNYEFSQIEEISVFLRFILQFFFKDVEVLWYEDWNKFSNVSSSILEERAKWNW